MTARDDLVASLDAALPAWKAWSEDKTLLGKWPPAEAILAPIETAIDALPAYQAVAGRSLFSGYSGVVIFSNTMALHTLYYALEQEADHASRAADWLIRILGTQHGRGFYYAPIWGMAVDAEAEIAPGIRLVPIDAVPDGIMRRRIDDHAEQQWNNTVWQSQNYYDRPASAIVRGLDAVSYIGNPETPFQQVDRVHFETRDHLAFLQASITGKPLVACSWFEWEDQTLDFNLHENWLVWNLPEVVPRVETHVVVAAANVAGIAQKFGAVQQAWRRVLVRSMNRFTLSQTRHNMADKALDLALAFEGILSGSSDGPASWKVAVRSAQIIGGELSARLEIRETLKNLYALRSSTAHGGGNDGASPAEVAALDRSVAIYRDLISAALEYTAPPDWKALELQARV
jgi:hypothetical protein